MGFAEPQAAVGIWWEALARTAPRLPATLPGLDHNPDPPYLAWMTLFLPWHLTDEEVGAVRPGVVFISPVDFSSP